MNKLSLIGYLTGLTIIVCSIIRWFFLWPDLSTMILAISIGIIVCGFSYTLDWMKNKDKELEVLNKRINDLTLWLTKQELK